MLRDELHARREAIARLVAKYGARHPRLFGSVARGEETPTSDVDILVELPRGYDLFTQRLALAAELERLIGRKVDLVPEHELNRHIRRQVLEEAVEL